MLGNFRPTQIVGGIRLSEGKEIHPIPFIIIIIIIIIIITGMSPCLPLIVYKLSFSYKPFSH
jgi:hypothetical protein